MRPLIMACPSCGGGLNVTRLNCPQCRIDIDGEFALPGLVRLSSAQLDFVEVFIKNRGVIREVERELGVSYPTVRARLDEVIRALGYQGREAYEDGPAGEDAAESKRRSVLEELKAGRITPEQALASLRDQGSARDPKEDPEK